METRRGNNEGSLLKRKSDGRWCAAVTTGHHPDTGKPIRVYYYGDTRSEVQTKLEQVTAPPNPKLATAVDSSNLSLDRKQVQVEHIFKFTFH